METTEKYIEIDGVKIDISDNPTKGKLFQRILKAKGVKAEDLARLLNLNNSTVFKWYQKNNFDTDVLEKIADALEIPISVFFTNTNSTFSSTGGIAANGSNNNVSGNIYNNGVNITLPPEGYKKIINADGKEITVLASSSEDNIRVQELEHELAAVNKKLSDYKDEIIMLQRRLLGFNE